MFTPYSLLLGELLMLSLNDSERGSLNSNVFNDARSLYLNSDHCRYYITNNSPGLPQIILVPRLL